MNNKELVEGNVCVFGDSITWGANDTELGGWANRLCLYCINNTDIEEDVTIFNLGIPCETTTDLLNRMDFECKIRQPKTIIIAIGINDSSYENNIDYPRTNINQFEDNIQKLIDISKKYTGNITFIGLTPVNELITKNENDFDINYYDNNMIKQYDNIIERVVEDNDLQYIYLFDKLKMNDLSEDGLHPNNLGHNKIFELLKDKMF